MMKQSDKSKMWDILNDNSPGLLKRKKLLFEVGGWEEGFHMRRDWKNKTTKYNVWTLIGFNWIKLATKDIWGITRKFWIGIRYTEKLEDFSVFNCS